MANSKARLAQNAKRRFSSDAFPTDTVTAASAIKPSFSTVTSSLTKSPSRNFLGPGISVDRFLVHANTAHSRKSVNQ
jgi:hypothetical protein